MAKRRPSGDGMVRKRDDGRWEGRIVVGHSTVQLLRKRKESALTEWIFPDLLKPEQPTHPNRAYRQLKKLLSGAGLPNIRFHDLRHTFATPAFLAVERNTDRSLLFLIHAHIVTASVEKCSSHSKGTAVFIPAHTGAEFVGDDFSVLFLGCDGSH